MGMLPFLRPYRPDDKKDKLRYEKELKAYKLDSDMRDITLLISVISLIIICFTIYLRV